MVKETQLILNPKGRMSAQINLKVKNSEKRELNDSTYCNQIRLACARIETSVACSGCPFNINSIFNSS